MQALTSSLVQNMEERGKKLIRVCANTKGAFTRVERFVEKYSIDPQPEQLEVKQIT